jgi:hypothetical protein
MFLLPTTSRCSVQISDEGAKTTFLFYSLMWVWMRVRVQVSLSVQYDTYSNTHALTHKRESKEEALPSLPHRLFKQSSENSFEGET